MFDRIFLVISVKKLLLCILSLILCLNTSVIHAQEPESLMIVAHPDDETIWGGSHLINGNYTVLCITNGNNKKRKKEFMKVMEKTHSKGIILSFPDKTKGKRDNWKSCKKDIQREIKKEIDSKDWGKIVTHNPDGEYGHIHHKKVSKYVTMILKKEDKTDQLIYFGKYTSKKNKAKLENEKKLSKKDYEIKVVMTKHAQEFVKPINFESLSKHKCEVSLFDETNEDPIAHITLAKWADIMVLVPATANIIAKVVHGIADDIVSTTFLACHTKKLICPAMNVHMYENEVTQRNIKLAKELGYKFVEPVVGHLACNDTGKGKLADVQDIVSAIDHEFELEQTLKGKNVLVSAGPTQEALDPVRFLSNHSSGKQGYAIAKAAKALGANVTLVAGPTALEDLNDVNMIHVTSAQDMFDAITSRLDDQNYIIMAAAVADYRPEMVADQKIKKSDEEVTFHFVKNPDILAYIGQHKKENQIICGFAMETQNLEENARKKLESKNCDMLIANNLFTSGAGFQTDTNVVTLLRKNDTQHLPKCSKEELGYKILETMKEIEMEK